MRGTPVSTYVPDKAEFARRAKQEFEAAVTKCKEYITAGDVIQVVLSQRLSALVRSHLFDVYRALRSLNPSPHMYYLASGDVDIVGSSPEILVWQDTIRPIAGTRPRGRSNDEGLALDKELLTDVLGRWESPSIFRPKRWDSSLTRPESGFCSPPLCTPQ